MQLVDSSGRETYTFAIEDEDGSVATFYNLILQLNADQQAYQPFLLKYEMDEAFVPIYLSTGTLENFSGRLTKIVLNGNLGVDRRGTASNGAGLDVDGTVCPGGSVSFGSGGGSGGGGWSTDPPDIADPDPNTQVKCTVYADVTDWYQADGTYMGRDYHSIWVECEDVEGSSADGDPCAPLNGEIGIIIPEKKPCKTGDEILDNENIQKALDDLWKDSDTEKPLNERRENGGWIIKNDQGDLSFQQVDWPSDACGMNPPTNFLENMPSKAIGFVHTHPFFKKEDTRSVCGEGAKKKYKPGFSEYDYEFLVYVAKQTLNFAFKGYVIDGNKITQYDFRGPDYQVQKNRCGY